MDVSELDSYGEDELFPWAMACTKYLHDLTDLVEKLADAVDGHGDDIHALANRIQSLTNEMNARGYLHSVKS